LRDIKKIFIYLVIFFPALVIAEVTGNAEQGKSKSTTCIACHNADGNSTVKEWPKIAGQGYEYLVQSLKEYRLGEKGNRNNLIMYPIVKNLTDQDIYDLASYFTQNITSESKSNQDNLDLGMKIYQGGIIEKGIPACKACHSPGGMGINLAKYPKLSYQHQEYTFATLKSYRDKVRINVMMNEIASKLSEDEMKAVSNYIEGLHE
jgi:cytochrome c553